MALPNQPSTQLRVVLIWDETVLVDRTVAHNESVTIGRGANAMLAVPDLSEHQLFSAKRELHATPQMRGLMWQGETRRALPSGTNAVALNPGDRGIVVFDADAKTAIYFQVDAVQRTVLPRTIAGDRFFKQAIAFSLLMHSFVLLLALWQWRPSSSLDVDPPPTQAIAKLVLEQAEEKQKIDKERGKQMGEKKRIVEPATSKRAEKKEGKAGDKNAKLPDTIIPKGPKDKIAAKVSDMGLLGAMKGKKSGALASLLSDANDDVTEAMAGVKGKSFAMGRGTGGMSTRGDGVGGGGTSKGQLFGVGNLQTGTGAGPRPGLGGGQGGHVAKETKVGMTTGSSSSEGGLTKEQIMRVVTLHRATIEFCYEKELQRFPNMAGKVDLYWKIAADGHVDLAKINSSALGNPGAESCMARTVRGWQFPKSTAPTIVTTFPFFFKGH